MFTIETRLAIYAGILVVISGWALYERHHLISEGEQIVIAKDKAAVAEQQKAVDAQRAKDQEASDAVAQSLQTELGSLRTQLAAAPSAANRSVRCYAQRPGPVPAAAGPTGSRQPADADAGGVAAVQGGPGGGSTGDIEPGLRLLAQAGGVAAAYQRACVTFSLKTAP